MQEIAVTMFTKALVAMAKRNDDLVVANFAETGLRAAVDLRRGWSPIDVEVTGRVEKGVAALRSGVPGRAFDARDGLRDDILEALRQLTDRRGGMERI